MVFDPNERHLVRVSPGTVIFREGVVGEPIMYLIRTGEVEVTKGNAFIARAGRPHSPSLLCKKLLPGNVDEARFSR